jgi:hypothetical protein
MSKFVPLQNAYLKGTVMKTKGVGVGKVLATIILSGSWPKVGVDQRWNGGNQGFSIHLSGLLVPSLQAKVGT